MFDILFGWRKASKCKQLIKQVQCRLKLLKIKRATIVRQLREDAAELIKNGYEGKAFNRVEQIIKDECIVAVYELLDNFCEFILLHLSYIRRHKDCPNDINEAVSSLIYASARCGDLPELRTIRKLFGERYGQKYVISALELFPGNLVNCQVIEKLSLKSVTDDMKHRLVNEIARNYCIKPEVLAIEYYSDWQQKVKEISGHQALDSNVRTYYKRSEMQICSVEGLETEDVHDSSISTTTSSVAKLAPTISDSPVHNEIQEEQDFAEVDSPRGGEIVVYNNDIEEVQSCTTRDGDDSQDQRAFKFKASVPKKENLENSFDRGHVNTWSVNSGSRVSTRSFGGNGKRPRKRSVSQENQFSKDSEFPSYYARKHQKKLGPNILSCKCSLVNPCYVCNGNENVEFEVPTLKQNRGISTRVGFANPGHEHKSLVYNVFTYPDHQPKQQSKAFKGNIEESGFQCKLPSYTSSSSSSSSPTVTSSWTRKEMVPPYFRNVTMPPERVNDKRKEEFQRSISDCFQYPTHVHPKLPDYDDIAAKFMALKKERLQTKPPLSNQL
ncbi:uncharacterized protein LOC133726160 isoform X1 [Rosa rugosa]|uniref:uncharacterized protein LOC133726160 isoform X1 n=1 Tax=Rosa rugosa TaxID=74645 RepID=UPI002B405746|nr:uncharacterized protein LOC133726160 isoform X1 [Rosa rugosa]